MRRGTAGRTILLAALIPLCWLAMQIIHEAGHVLAAWMTGGTITSVVLHPLAISRTDVAPNPSPLTVAWGGPLVGVVVPVAAWIAVAQLWWPSSYLWRFFAGFCLIANGAYLGSAVLTPVGDAADLLRLGAPLWTLAAFGVVTISAGFVLWNGLGSSFGLGKEPPPIAAWHAVWVLAVFALVVIAELVWTQVTGFV